LVFFRFAVDPRSEAEMRLDEVVISKGHRPLLLQPLSLLGQGTRLSDPSSVLLTPSQVVPFDKTGVDMTAHR
jgi:hypothetical protein